MKTTIILFLMFLCNVENARILGIFPLPGRSHYHLTSALMRELAERGHDVTVVSHFSEKNPPKNGTYREILLTELFDFGDNKGWNMFNREGLDPFTGAVYFATMAYDIIEKSIKHKNVQNLLNSDEKFDVVILEQFLNDAFKAFAVRFNAPLIVFSTFGPSFWVNPLVGNPSPPSYIPDVMLGYSSHMSFCERLTNSLLNIFNQFLYHSYAYPKQNELIQKYIPNGPNLHDILYNISLVLLNSHPSLNQPVPLVPNMIEIGGFHMKPPKKLPPDLQEFLDDAKEGVIYFSMGSVLKSAQFPVEKRQIFINAFSKLKQKVLWKWENDGLPDQPSNVKVAKWVPQGDLLAHPNIKLFITHGGFVSSVETAYHGVPVLVLPIYGDQKLNAQFALENGFGRFINYRELSEETLLQNINQMLNNPGYQEMAKRRSQIFHDRLVKPMDTAIFWVEYVIRHKGAPHLRVAALNLPWYQYHLLDVLGVVSIVILSLFLMFRYIFKNGFSKKAQKKEKEKNH